VITINALDCVGCGQCAFVCQFDAIAWQRHKGARIDQDKCSGCESCVGFDCPGEAFHKDTEDKQNFKDSSQADTF
jgi:MinD superfamily P-loop ATPase